MTIGGAIMRRAVLAGLPLAALAVPPVARAQPRPRRVVLLVLNDTGDAVGAGRVAALRDALPAAVRGPLPQLEVVWGVSDAARARAAVAARRADPPDVIVANGTPATTALREAAREGWRDVPVVFAVVTDPVGAGFVDSLARPGGNITGFSTFEPEIGGKWVETLRELRPDLLAVAGLVTPELGGFAAVWRACADAAARFGMAASSVPFSSPDENVEAALASAAASGRSGLIVLPTAVNNVARARIIAAAARLRLPAIYPFRFYADDGGLLYYGFDSRDLFRRAADYVGRILAGERPADLPVQAPTRFELVVNLAAARAQGIAVPPGLLARADDVIE
jgi:putative ABC transport system substrate-binding protein